MANGSSSTMDQQSHGRQGFHESLRQVTQEVLAMGVLVEEAIRRAVRSLVERDGGAARDVVARDAVLDRMQTAIEDRAIALVATEQPVATDLRRLVTGLKVVTQLERMGDHAAHVGKATLRMEGEPDIRLPPQIPEMGRLGNAMLKRAMGALVDNDAGRTLDLVQMDRRVDLLYDETMAELSGRMRREPALVDMSLRLVFVARHLERLADHATNIGEWVVYGETARHVALNP